MSNEVVAGIDIGGTKIAIALQNLAGERIASARLPTPVELEAREVLEKIFQTIQTMLAETGTMLKAIGIGCPGAVDIEKGLVLAPSNLPKWVDFPIVELVTDRYGVPAALDNDANAAALGEYFYGAGQGYKDIFYITISTGIGGALIWDGHLHHGLSAGAGEIGHTIVVPDGLLCRCGSHGCLETIASGLSIARRMKEKLIEAGKITEYPAEITAETVVEAVKQGDETAQLIWDETCQYLAIGIGNAIALTAPDAIIIGGGVSAAGELLLEPLRRELKENIKMIPIEEIQILKASLGGESGVCGALMMAQQTYQKNLIEC